MSGARSALQGVPYFAHFVFAFCFSQGLPAVLAPRDGTKCAGTSQRIGGNAVNVFEMRPLCGGFGYASGAHRVINT